MDPQSYLAMISSNPSMFPGSGPINPFNLMNMQGVPGMSGPGGMFASMILSPMMQSLAGDRFIPAQFSPTLNLYDQYRKQRDYSNMMATMSQSRSIDQANYARILRGMVGTAGVTLNAQRERAIQNIVGDFGGIAGTLGPMMPDLFDQLHGSRGSAVLMAQNMFQGGRYSFDPVTGLPGLSTSSAARMNSQVYRSLYGDGADISLLRGLGAGRAGALYDELQRRGLGAPSLTAADRQGVYARGIAESAGSGLETMFGALSRLPEMSDKLRDMQSGRITQKLKEMAGAVAAMKDIFGENGNPNAPIGQIIEGLQAISQGGLNQIGGSRVEQMVRETSNLARRSGLGMDNMMQLMASGTQITDALGLNRLFANNVALSGAAFGAAYGANAGGVPAWGRQDKAFMTALDSRLTAGATNSQAANTLATMIRLQDEAGFAPDSEAAALVRSLKENPNSLTYNFGGQSRSIYPGQAQMERMAVDALQRSGMSPNEAREAFNRTRRQSAWNQKTVFDYGLDVPARLLQGPLDASVTVQGAFFRAFRSAGMNREEASANASRIAQNAFNVDPSQASDPEALLSAAGLSSSDPRLRRAAISGLAELTQILKTNPDYAQFKGSADAYLQSFNRKTLQSSAVLRDSARTEAQLQTALSGLGRGSPIERLIDTIMENSNGELSFRDFATRALGGVPGDDVMRALEGPSKKLIDEIRRYESAPNGQVRRDALDKIQGMTRNLRKTAENLGIGEMGSVTSTQSGTALRAFEGRGATALDLAEQMEIMLGQDRRSYQLLGGGADGILRSMGSNNRALRSLTGKYGVGLGGLFATDGDRDAAFSLLQDEGGVRSEIGALQSIRAGMRNGQNLDTMLTEMAKDPKLSGLVATLRSNLAGKSGTEINAGLNSMLEQNEAKYNAIQKNKQEMADRFGTSVEALANRKSVTEEDRQRAQSLVDQQLGLLKDVHRSIGTGVNPYQKDIQGATNALTAARATGNPALIAAAEARLKGATAAMDSSVASFDERFKLYSMAPDAAYSQFSKALGSGLTLDQQSSLKEDVLKSGLMNSPALRDMLPALKSLRAKASERGVGLKELIASIRQGGSKEERELLGQISGIEDLVDFNASNQDFLKGLSKVAGPATTAEPKKPQISMNGTLKVDITTGQGVLTATGTSQGFGDRETT